MLGNKWYSRRNIKKIKDGLYVRPVPYKPRRRNFRLYNTTNLLTIYCFLNDYDFYVSKQNLIDDVKDEIEFRFNNFEGGQYHEKDF